MEKKVRLVKGEKKKTGISIKVRDYKNSNKGYNKVKRKKAKPSSRIITRVFERVATGIPGFDSLVEGGLVLRSINLVEGDPGTNKSIFCMQYLIEGIEKYNEAGIYISFEEKKENVYKDMLLFGWDLEKYEKEGKFIFLEYTPEQVDKVIKFGGGIVLDTITSINAKRMVIDSLTAIISLYNSTIKQREILLKLFELIRKWECTAMLISESAQDMHSHKPDIEEYEVDGVILLYSVLEKKGREKYLEVFKMRGTKHSNKVHTIKITNKGILVK